MLNALYLVRSAFAARIWDDRQRGRVPVYDYLSGGHRGGLMIVVSFASSFLLAFPTTQPTSAHDLPILPELPLPPGVAFLAIGDQTTSELAIRPPGLRHLHPYCHSHTQPSRIGQTGIAEWCRQIHSYDHWIEIQVVGGGGGE